jgi:hypothetical protein
VVREDGALLGWGRGQPAARQGRTVTGTGRSQTAVQEALTKALEGIVCDELLVVNYSPRFPYACFAPHCRGRVRFRSVREAPAARALAGVRDGIVAVAGTGAVVGAVTREGRESYLDGLGPMLGDHGSGFHIGLMAIRAAAQSGWHPRRGTALADAVYAHLGGRVGDRHGDSLITYMLGDRDRSEIASVARIVNEQAERGDSTAVDLLQQAAADMAGTVFDLADTLGMTAEAYPFVGTGSVATRSRIYWERLCELVAEFAPAFVPMRSPLPPVIGVALWGLQHGGSDGAARERLIEEAAAHFDDRAA